MCSCSWSFFNVSFLIATILSALLWERCPWPSLSTWLCWSGCVCALYSRVHKLSHQILCFVFLIMQSSLIGLDVLNWVRRLRWPIHLLYYIKIQLVEEIWGGSKYVILVLNLYKMSRSWGCLKLWIVVVCRSIDAAFRGWHAGRYINDWSAYLFHKIACPRLSMLLYHMEPSFLELKRQKNSLVVRGEKNSRAAGSGSYEQRTYEFWQQSHSLRHDQLCFNPFWFRFPLLFITDFCSRCPVIDKGDKWSTESQQKSVFQLVLFI